MFQIFMYDKYLKLLGRFCKKTTKKTYVWYITVYYMEKSIEHSNSVNEKIADGDVQNQMKESPERMAKAMTGMKLSKMKDNVSMDDYTVFDDKSSSIKEHYSPYSSKNNYAKTSKNLSIDSIQKPLVYPFIEENEDYIRIFIYNPEAGKEGDLIHFYDKTYWDLVGLYPEVNVLDKIFPDDKDKSQTLQKGGGDSDKDELSGPYKYFKGIMELFFKPKADNNTAVNTNNDADKNTTLNVNNNTGKSSIFNTSISTANDMHTDTSVVDNDNANNRPPSLFGLNPVNPNTTLNTDKNEDAKENDKQDGKENNKQDDKHGNNIVSSLSNIVLPNEPSVKSDGNAIVLTFFPNNGFKSFIEVLETRNPELDIDVTQSKYKFKELHKIDMIKKKKNLLTDISVEEVFYIDGKLIVLKGMLNINANGVVKVASNEILIETKTEMSNFMMDKFKSFDVISDNPFF